MINSSCSLRVNEISVASRFHPLLQLLDSFSPCLKDPGPIPGWTTGYQHPTKSALTKYRSDRWDNATKPFVRRWQRNIRVELHPGEEISRCIYLNGAYEPNQLHFLKQVLKPMGVFLDIGANSGIYSLVAAQIVGQKGQVFAIEPSGREFKHLQKNVELNRQRNIRPLRLAIGDQEGFQTLRVAAIPRTGHNTLLTKFSYEDTALESVEEVKVTTIDALIKSEKISRLDVVKLDIEGYELPAIMGAMRTLEEFHPTLLVEMLARNEESTKQVHALWARLQSLGYRLLAYHLETGLPFEIDRYPGPGYTDFIATTVSL